MNIFEWEHFISCSPYCPQKEEEEEYEEKENELAQTRLHGLRNICDLSRFLHVNVFFCIYCNRLHARQTHLDNKSIKCSKFYKPPNIYDLIEFLDECISKLHILTRRDDHSMVEIETALDKVLNNLKFNEADCLKLLVKHLQHSQDNSVLKNELVNGYSKISIKWREFLEYFQVNKENMGLEDLHTKVAQIDSILKQRLNSLNLEFN